MTLVRYAERTPGRSIKIAEAMEVAAPEKANLANFQRPNVAIELSREAAEEEKDGKVFSALGAPVTRFCPSEKDVVGFELQREKIRLLRKLEEAEAEVEEMKKRRAEDARANEKVATIFATQRQHWKMEKKKLKQQLQILLKQSQAFEEYPSEENLDCSRCARKDSLLSDLEAKSLQMEDELVRAFKGLEICKKDCKIMSEEKREITERLSAEIVRLQRDIDEKDEVISSLLRKTDEKEELERKLTLVEAKRKQGDWPGLEKSLHAVHIKQRHLLEMDAFERQMRAKDERMEVFRQKLLSMDNKLEKLQAENRDLMRSLELAKAKNANLEIMLKNQDFVLGSLKDNLILHEKSKMHSHSEQSLQELEDGKCKIEKVEHNTINFRAVEESKAKDEEFREFTSPAVKAKSLQTQADYEKGKERPTVLLKSSKSVPINYLRDRNFLCERLENIDGDSERVLPRENPHLICLIQQATQAFGPCFHRETGPEGMLQATKENAGNSRLHSLLTRACHKEQDGNPREELPTVVDKHVSGTCKCGNSMDNDQTEDVVVAPVKFQSERAIWGEWQKGRAIASVDSASQFSLPGRNGQLKGKTVFQDQYTTEKRVERGLDDVHYGGEAEKQTTELSTTPVQTIPVKSFPARKNDEIPCDASSYLKHILEGRYSSTKKDAEALAISSEVKRLEQQLLQLEKISKAEVSKRICSKDETPIMDRTTENENDYQQVKSKSASLSAIQLLKKQFKRYQALIGKIDDLCTRIHEKDPAHTNTVSRSREQIAAQELFLIETFQLQHYLAATGQKLVAIQSDITHKFCAMDNEIVLTANFNMMQSVESIKSHLKEMQRSLEKRLARIIGDLEGTLARDGILHVMPVEWKEDHNTKFGKSKQEITS